MIVIRTQSVVSTWHSGLAVAITASLSWLLGACHLAFPFDTVSLIDASADAVATVDLQVQSDSSVPDAPGADLDPALPGEWVSIPSGIFMMGSPLSELCREIGGGKETLHQVTLTYGLEIQATEVTQGQFQALMGYNPSDHGPNGTHASCGTDCPVEAVNWHESAAYCNALSQKTGKTPCYSCTGEAGSVTCLEASGYSGKNLTACPGYRLPTEAEWEYAYRAGSTTALYNGPVSTCDKQDNNADVIAWYGENAVGRPHVVGAKLSNEWGLFDMAGNVYEWCHDRFQPDLTGAPVTDPVGPATGTERLLRGGAWNNFTRMLRAAYRFKTTPSSNFNNVGFRCVRRN